MFVWFFLIAFCFPPPQKNLPKNEEDEWTNAADKGVLCAVLVSLPGSIEAFRVFLEAASDGGLGPQNHSELQRF